MAIAKDLVSGILSGNIDTSATNIIVSIGEGLSSSQITGFFPATPFHMTIMPKSPTIGVANSFDSEVIKVTAVAADQSGDASLTVVRGQYDTTAKSFDSGAIVTLGVYAEDAVFKSDDVLPPAEAWVGSDDIKANAVKAENIDFATFSFSKTSLTATISGSGSPSITTQNMWSEIGDNGGLGKIYGRIDISKSGAAAMTISISDTGLRPSTQTTIVAACIYSPYDNTYHISTIDAADLIINTDGTAYVTLNRPASELGGQLIIIPQLLFI